MRVIDGGRIGEECGGSLGGLVGWVMVGRGQIRMGCMEMGCDG